MNNPPRNVARIEWPNRDMTSVPTMHSQDGNRLTLENTYHGDHDEDWIVARDEQGRERARYNPRCMSAIIFEW